MKELYTLLTILAAVTVILAGVGLTQYVDYLEGRPLSTQCQCKGE